MNPKDHALFKQHPLNSAVALSVGEVPVPYHIYDGYGVFIGGSANLDATKRMLQHEQVVPIQTTDGRAALGIWVCDFLQASLDPHHELQFSIFVSREAVPPISAHPVGLLSAMLTRPDMQMMCHGLWNNTPKVVAYNREQLSLNARLTHSNINLSSGTQSFTFSDSETGKRLLDGHLALPKRTPQTITRALMGHMGLVRTLRIAVQPSVHMAVVNPLGVSLTRNATADAYTKNESNLIRAFDPLNDRLSLGEVVYNGLDFQPHIIQFMTGFKFVYLNPH